MFGGHFFGDIRGLLPSRVKLSDIVKNVVTFCHGISFIMLDVMEFIGSKNRKHRRTIHNDAMVSQNCKIRTIR